MHPLSGWDHMLALLAIGWMAWQQKSALGMAVLPSTFIGGLVAGALLGVSGFAPVSMEYGIAFSLLMFGVFMALVVKVRYVWPFVLIAGLYHGFAHGAEMPANSGAVAYFAGFLFCSVILVFLGLQGHQRLAQTVLFQKIRKAISGVLILAGLYMISGIHS
jgi:urease accessory protein